MCDNNVICTAGDLHLKTEANWALKEKKTGKLQFLYVFMCFQLLSRYTHVYLSTTNWQMMIILHKISLWLLTHSRRDKKQQQQLINGSWINDTILSFWVTLSNDDKFIRKWLCDKFQFRSIHKKIVSSSALQFLNKFLLRMKSSINSVVFNTPFGVWPIKKYHQPDTTIDHTVEIQHQIDQKTKTKTRYIRFDSLLHPESWSQIWKIFWT